LKKINNFEGTAGIFRILALNTANYSRYGIGSHSKAEFP